MKKYVIQMRKNAWSNQWIVRSEHDTLEEAKAGLESIPLKAGYRLGGAYTVIRYKAVKI